MVRVTEDAVKVADEVWVATALLHREYPDRSDFTVEEIVRRAKRENIAGQERPSVYQHAQRHNVANTAKSPNRYRLLFATGPKRRRLYRPGDPANPQRVGSTLGSRTIPSRDGLPKKYRHLLDWYETEYALRPARKSLKDDPILALRGLGREIWKGVDADEYVRKLREEWD